jgi:predicted TIM-barrel fold metal-dependent hydrolase
MPVVSADSHVIEPHDLWQERLPQRFAESAPVFAAQSVFDVHAGGHDPDARLTAMVQDGLVAEVLYPSLGLTLYSEENAELQRECFRVYNDWLAEYCSVSPRRLVGVPAICAYDVAEALDELERSRRRGLQGACLWLRPDPRVPYSSRHYDDLWRVAERDRIPISFHILSGFDHTQKERAAMRDPSRLHTLDRERYFELARDNSNGKIAECADTLFELMFSGVFDRFPELRVVLVEADVGWIPFFAQRWDYYASRNKTIAHKLGLERTPSEYLSDNISVTFVCDPVGAKLVADHGIATWMWSSDFPHAASTWPDSMQFIEEHLGYLPSGALRDVVSGNAGTLYDIDVSPAGPVGVPSFTGRT